MGTSIPSTHRVAIDVAVSFLSLLLAELGRASLVLVSPTILRKTTASTRVLPLIPLIPVEVVVLSIILLSFLPILVALLGLTAMETLLAEVILVAATLTGLVVVIETTCLAAATTCTPVLLFVTAVTLGRSCEFGRLVTSFVVLPS